MSVTRMMSAGFDAARFDWLVGSMWITLPANSICTRAWVIGVNVMLPPVAGMVSAAIVAPNPAIKTAKPNHSRMESLLESVISGFSFLVFKSFVFDAVKCGRLPQRCQLCCYVTQERPPQS